MKLQRFVIGFIVGSSLTILVAGIWFNRPAAEIAKPPGTISPVGASSPGDAVVAAQR